MSEYRIRMARRGDAEAIGSLWSTLMEYHRQLDPRFHAPQGQKQQYIRHAQSMIQSRESHVLVAEETATGIVVGYLMGELQQRSFAGNIGTFGFISDMFVEERFRRKGVGRALYTEMRRWFFIRRVHAVELYASVINPTSQAFWVSMGFQPFLTLMHLDIDTN